MGRQEVAGRQTVCINISKQLVSSSTPVKSVKGRTSENRSRAQSVKRQKSPIPAQTQQGCDDKKEFADTAIAESQIVLGSFALYSDTEDRLPTDLEDAHIQLVRRIQAVKRIPRKLEAQNSQEKETLLDQTYSEDDFYLHQMNKSLSDLSLRQR